MITIKNLYEAAYRAHYNTSFYPEKRAETIVKEYTEQLNSDLQQIRAEEQERYTENYKKYLFNWLRAKSNCISSMITGPANFPVARAEKVNLSEHNRYNEFADWRERALKAIEKKKESSKTPEQKSLEAWQSIEATILDKTQCINEIDKGINTYTSRQLIVANLCSFIKRIAQNGQVEHLKKSLELIRKINEISPKPVVTANNGIWKLEQQAEAKREAIVDNQTKETQFCDFVGGKIAFNYQLDRLQLLFDEKPASEMIMKLKKNGFKWSPTNKAWQRQLTQNAIYATKHYLGIEILKPQTA